MSTIPVHITWVLFVLLIILYTLPIPQHDIIVDKVPISFLNHKLTEVLPLPLGDYCISSSMIFHGIIRGEVKTYFTTS